MRHSIKAIKEALAASGAEVSSFLIQDARAELQDLSVVLGDSDYAYTLVVKVYDKSVYKEVYGLDWVPEDHMLGVHMYTFFAETPSEAQEIIDCYADHGRLEPKDPYIRISVLDEDC